MNLVVWDPVLSGANYLKELAQAHVGFLANVFRWKPGRVARSRGIRALDSMQELVGFECARAAARGIEAIDLGAQRRILSRSVTVLGDQPAEEYAKLRAVVAASGRESALRADRTRCPLGLGGGARTPRPSARTLDALLAAVENPA